MQTVLIVVHLIIVLALVRKRVLWWSDGEVTAKG